MSLRPLSVGAPNRYCVLGEAHANPHASDHRVVQFLDRSFCIVLVVELDKSKDFATIVATLDCSCTKKNTSYHEQQTLASVWTTFHRAESSKKVKQFAFADLERQALNVDTGGRSLHPAYTFRWHVENAFDGRAIGFGLLQAATIDCYNNSAYLYCRQLKSRQLNRLYKKNGRPKDVPHQRLAHVSCANFDAASRKLSHKIEMLVEDGLQHRGISRSNPVLSDRKVCGPAVVDKCLRHSRKRDWIRQSAFRSHSASALQGRNEQ